MLEFEGAHFIGGNYVRGKGEVFQSRNPADDSVLAELAFADDSEMEQALTAARAGFAVWKKTAPVERARILHKAALILRRDNRALSELETMDTGKPLQETLVADAASGADCLEYFASQAASMTGDFIPFAGQGHDFAYTRRAPLGICFGIGAWNYPIQIACWKAAPALACGNAMIFKPSRVTPLSALKLAEALTEAGLPAGVFNVLQGNAAMATKLINHPDIAKVSLTGHVNTGKKVMQASAATLKHVTLELGGKSPLIVFDDASIDEAVGAAMLANFYSTGQVCTNGTRVYLQEAIYDSFVEKLIKRTKKMKMGDPLDEATETGPLVSKAHFDEVLACMEIARKEGQVLLGGGAAEVKGFEKGHWVHPMIVALPDEKSQTAQEEIFGPVLSIFKFNEEEEVVQRANASPFGLAAGVMTNNLKRAHRVAENLEAGICWVNNYNLTPVEIPFGGVKLSGLGRENSRIALDHYSEWKTVYIAMDAVDSPY